MTASAQCIEANIVQSNVHLVKAIKGAAHEYILIKYQYTHTDAAEIRIVGMQSTGLLCVLCPPQ